MIMENLTFTYKGKDNLYNINLKLFMENQYKIMDKYLNALNNLNTFEKIDKYIMQIIEEIWEFKTAENDIEKLKELCDVVMYVASTYSLIEKETNISLDIDFENVVIYRTNSFSIDIVFEEIINIRRLFPERKWHKKENNDIRITHDEIKVTLSMLYNIIKDIFQYLLYLSNKFSPFNYIETKENNILSNK